MKTKHWMKLAVATFLLCSSLASAAQGEKGGNGGGGIRRNGTYLTFGSANLHVGLEPLDQVPGLELLEQTIMQLKISPQHRAALINVILSDGHRNYFAIKELDLDSNKKQAFLEAYQSAISTNPPTADLVVFAATSRSESETYLLPEFFQLKPIEQAAILFHEALWLLMPASTSYNFVIDAEIKFQKYLEKGGKGYDPKLYPVLDEVFKDHMLSLKIALQDDYDSGVLKNFLVSRDFGNGVKKTYIPLEALFSKEALHIYSRDHCPSGLADNCHFDRWYCIGRLPPPPQPGFTNSSGYADPYQTMILYMATNMRKYPKSKALRRIYELRSTLRFNRPLNALETGTLLWAEKFNGKNNCATSASAPAIDLTSLENSDPESIVFGGGITENTGFIFDQRDY